jgi:hypothetical protein
VRARLSVVKQLTLPSFNDPRPVFDAGSNVTISKIKIDGSRVANRPDRWSDSYNDAGKGFKNSTCCGRGRGYRSGIRGESITGLTVDRVEFTALAGAALATNNSSSVTFRIATSTTPISRRRISMATVLPSRKFRERIST